MGKKCLNCDYERQPSDMAPDYECPQCGTIYAKAEAKKLKQESEPIVSETVLPETASTKHENRFIRFVKKYRKTSITIIVLCLLSLIGILGEYYLIRSFETQLRRFDNNLLMVDKESFETSLDSLMDIIETSCKRVTRYSLSSDSIATHVLGAMDASREFIRLMEETSDGESILYDYDVRRTAEILHGNLDIIFSHVEDKRSQAIISQRQLVMNLRGTDVKKRTPKARHRELLRPKDVTGELEASEERKKKEHQKESMEARMTMGVLKRRCENGVTHACEALEDMKNRGNQEAALRYNQHRMWQGWAQSAREQARRIPVDSGETITIQSWDGEFVEISRDNVEDVIEGEEPEEI